ncbi:MAG: T9SS type A sorting domain-containing protein [Candidatus Cloacimonetes bacterium]|nr:T9SS type A sorting domain-containing protein [Candidatus Cloacimonadota bacterium]
MKRLIYIILFLSMSLPSLADPPDWIPITGTQYSMVLFARIINNDEYFTNSDENIAAAFGPGGDTDCRSLAGWQVYEPDGFWYFNIVGNENGEEITFKIYDSALDLVLVCEQTLVFVDNDIIGSPAAPETLTINTSLITGNVSLITSQPPAADVTETLISNGSAAVHPDADGNYQLPAEPGIYDLTASLTGYSPQTLSGIEVLATQITSNINFQLIDWLPVTGTQYNMVMMCELLFNDEPVSGVEGYFLGAFGASGYDDCRGLATWQPPNPPYWDGYWYFTIVSNAQNDNIYFKVYEHSTAGFYDCQEAIIFENDATLGSPDAPFTLNIDNSGEQTIDLSAEWNWISFFVEPEDMAVPAVFAPLVPAVYQVKDQTHSLIYFAEIQTWLGDLNNITSGDSYLVYMNQSFPGFTLSGSVINSNTPIPLNTEWNWTAYYPQYELSLSAALGSIVPLVEQVKTQAQSANYIDPPGEWVGDLLTMEPGVGYKIFMNSSADLIYGDAEGAAAGPTDDNTDDPPLWEVITGTQYSMVLMTTISLDEQFFQLDNGNIAAAFGPAGESDCRSLAAWQPPNPPNYEGFWYFTIVGNIIGESISFRIYDQSGDQIFTNSASLTFSDNTVTGSPYEPYTLDFVNTPNNLVELPDHQNRLISIYPNPFNPLTTITFESDGIHSSEIAVYNLKGQRLEILCNSTFPAGIHTLTWNAATLPTGIYFLKTPASPFPLKTLLLK